MGHHVRLAFACVWVASLVLAPGALAGGPQDPVQHIVDSACAMTDGIACVAPAALSLWPSPVQHAVDAAYAIIRSFATMPQGPTLGQPMAMEAR
ncbi:MAG: hypothetical protein LC624_06775 [Halobacteriales archaeon]|nr:hypothetical protein [Halobacteriales archaeon]